MLGVTRNSSVLVSRGLVSITSIARTNVIKNVSTKMAVSQLNLGRANTRMFSTGFIRLQDKLNGDVLSNNTKIKEDEVKELLSKLSSEQLAELRRMKHEKKNEFKNKTITYYFTSVILVFLGLAYAAVPLYRAICARTGFGGIPITDKRKFTNDKLVPVASEKRIRVSFSSEVSNILPWKFTPEQKEVYVLPGETALAFYKAKNTSDKDIIGMATYSITPGDAAQYFNKIQCFCFEEQKLNAGEEIDMPVFFFIDPEFANDPSMENVDDIILHYCFFKAHYSDGTAVSDGSNVLQVVDASKHE